MLVGTEGRVGGTSLRGIPKLDRALTNENWGRTEVEHWNFY